MHVDAYGLCFLVRIIVTDRGQTYECTCTSKYMHTILHPRDSIKRGPGIGDRGPGDPYSLEASRTFPSPTYHNN